MTLGEDKKEDFEGTDRKMVSLLNEEPFFVYNKNMLVMLVISHY